MKEFLYSAIILRYTVVREKGLSVAFPGLPLNFYMKFISKKKNTDILHLSKSESMNRPTRSNSRK